MTLPDTRKLYQQVASTIMGSIMSGKYKPGERLPSERDLAVAFKVSRPTIREAMIALEIRGLAETRHGSGIYVTDQPAAATNSADLDIGAFELTEARRLFEGEAAALAATQVSDEIIEELERIIAEMEDENARGQQDWTADRRFHIAIARATRNTAIATVIENLLDMRHKSPLCVYMLERARRVGVQPRVSEHRRILVALRKHDPRAARMRCATTWRGSSRMCWRRPGPKRWGRRRGRPRSAMTTYAGWQSERCRRRCATRANPRRQSPILRLVVGGSTLGRTAAIQHLAAGAIFIAARRQPARGGAGPAAAAAARWHALRRYQHAGAGQAAGTRRVRDLEPSHPSLPFASSSFGLVCALDIVEHVDDEDAALSEISRVAKASALLLLSVPLHPRAGRPSMNS